MLNKTVDFTNFLIYYLLKNARDHKLTFDCKLFKEYRQIVVNNSYGHGSS